ncbi:MAG TPA: hypothetical protein VGE95_00280 [Arthrobacter sp.]
MVLPESREHCGEPFTVWIQFSFIPGPGCSPASAHERVKMGGERYFPEPRPSDAVQGDVEEVLVVEVPVRHGHRFAPGGAHGKKGRCVVLGREQTYFPADQLGVRAGSAQVAEECHLFRHRADGVAAVDPYLVRVG